MPSHKSLPANVSLPAHPIAVSPARGQDKHTALHIASAREFHRDALSVLNQGHWAHAAGLLEVAAARLQTIPLAIVQLGRNHDRKPAAELAAEFLTLAAMLLETAALQTSDTEKRALLLGLAARDWFASGTGKFVTDKALKLGNEAVEMLVTLSEEFHASGDEVHSIAMFEHSVSILGAIGETPRQKTIALMTARRYKELATVAKEANDRSYTYYLGQSAIYYGMTDSPQVARDAQTKFQNELERVGRR